MTPLRVTARILGAIAMPNDPIALDALLAAAVATRDCLPPPDCGITPIEVPIAREPARRFHLASQAQYAFEGYDVRWVNRRFPIDRAQEMATAKVRTIRITSGPAKSYRIPLESGRLINDRIDWYCIGEGDEIRALLQFVTHLGKRRAVGLGRVESWEVEPIHPWEGFPVLRDGVPLRPLPIDWPGLGKHRREYRTLTYPYWDNAQRALVAVA